MIRSTLRIPGRKLIPQPRSKVLSVVLFRISHVSLDLDIFINLAYTESEWCSAKGSANVHTCQCTHVGYVIVYIHR